MFPGYTVIFKDEQSFIHLYFFPGIDDNDNFYYRDLDLSNCQVKYTESINVDGSKEYVFENKNEIVFSKNNIKSITTNKLYF